MKNLVNYVDDFFDDDASLTEAIKRNRPKTAIKAMRKANREIEYETKGAGWHSTHSTHKSVKDYTRKAKHKIKY